MKQFKFLKVFIFLIIIKLTTFNFALASEPIVVLEYSSHSTEKTALNNSNAFISNPNFSSKHRVKENETLGHILYSYYGKSGLNLRIVEMAIVDRFVEWRRCVGSIIYLASRDKSAGL